MNSWRIQKILLVDDEPQLVVLASGRLKANGYDVITAPNGIVCLEKAKKELPDLILLDMMMPKMDGYQTLEKLKEDESTKQIPVVVFSAKAIQQVRAFPSIQAEPSDPPKPASGPKTSVGVDVLPVDVCVLSPP